MKSLIIFVACSILFLSANAQQQATPPPTKKLKVLVFSKTEGYRHQSIAEGIKMLSNLAQKENWTLTATEDATLFNTDFLGNFDVIVFLSPTEKVLTEQQRDAFKAFMKRGKGFVGIHAATDCEFDWPWYGKLVGTYFKIHPPTQQATVVFEDMNHPSMAAFKGMDSYTTIDEWYSFTSNPRKHVHVLAHLDESTIKKTNKDDNWQMGDHPLIWYQEFEGIRSFYTVFGHTTEAFQDSKIQAHLAGAINWAAS